jgi:predicted Na+-dependent transporter
MAIKEETNCLPALVRYVTAMPLRDAQTSVGLLLATAAPGTVAAAVGQVARGDHARAGN